MCRGCCRWSLPSRPREGPSRSEVYLRVSKPFEEKNNNNQPPPQKKEFPSMLLTISFATASAASLALPEFSLIDLPSRTYSASRVPSDKMSAVRAQFFPFRPLIVLLLAARTFFSEQSSDFSVIVAVSNSTPIPGGLLPVGASLVSAISSSSLQSESQDPLSSRCFEMGEATLCKCS